METLTNNISIIFTRRIIIIWGDVLFYKHAKLCLQYPVFTISSRISGADYIALANLYIKLDLWEMSE